MVKSRHLVLAVLMSILLLVSGCDWFTKKNETKGTGSITLILTKEIGTSKGVSFNPTTSERSLEWKRTAQSVVSKLEGYYIMVTNGTDYTQVVDAIIPEGQSYVAKEVTGIPAGTGYTVKLLALGPKVKDESRSLLGAGKHEGVTVQVGQQTSVNVGMDCFSYAIEPTSTNGTATVVVSVKGPILGEVFATSASLHYLKTNTAPTNDLFGTTAGGAVIATSSPATATFNFNTPDGGTYFVQGDFEINPQWSSGGTLPLPRFVTPSIAMSESMYSFQAVGGSGSVVVNPVWNLARIAYSTKIGYDYVLRVANADGTNDFEFKTNASNPKWSPDGTKIAYTKLDLPSVSSCSLYVANADGSNETKVSSLSGGYSRDLGNRKFDWSPDGTQIAFIPAGQELWVANVGSYPGTKIKDLWITDVGYEQLLWASNNSIYLAARNSTAAGIYKTDTTTQALPTLIHTEAVSNYINDIDWYLDVVTYVTETKEVYSIDSNGGNQQHIGGQPLVMDWAENGDYYGVHGQYIFRRNPQGGQSEPIHQYYVMAMDYTPGL